MIGISCIAPASTLTASLGPTVAVDFLHLLLGQIFVNPDLVDLTSNIPLNIPLNIVTCLIFIETAR